MQTVKPAIIQISDDLFLKLGKLVSEKYGIKMPIAKKIMFQARLQRRLRELNLKSFEEYADKLLDENEGIQEFSVLADLISTNKTEFFRGKAHFDFMKESVLPYFKDLMLKPDFPHLKIWSAGCSSGQEAYSLAITIEEFGRTSGYKFRYYITATDISTRMLKTAKTAIYPMEHVNEIEMDLKKKYFLKSKDMNDPKVRIAKEIRDGINFDYLNLMDDSYQVNDDFHVIFLRNTLIYFEPQIQIKILLKVLNKLVNGGFLFIGHSESLVNLDLPIRSIAPSVYVKNI